MRSSAALALLAGLFLSTHLTASVPAQNDLSFLSRAFGPRSAGLAGAVTSSADDPSAVFVNPALLAYFNNSGLLASHEQTPSGISTEFLSLTHPLARGTLAWTVLYHHAPDLEIISLSGLTGESLRFQNLSGSLSYGRSVWQRGPYSATAGLSCRYAAAFLPDSFLQAFLFDLGGVFQYAIGTILPALDDIRLGLSFLNILPGFDYAGKAADTDFVFRSGLSTGYRKILSLSCGLTASQNLGARFSVGLEFFPVHFLALRAGYLFGRQGEGLHAGLGIGNNLHKGGLSFELGLRPSPDRGLITESAVHWTFDGPFRYLALQDRISLEEKATRERETHAAERLKKQEARAAEKNEKSGKEEPAVTAESVRIKERPDSGETAQEHLPSFLQDEPEETE